MCSSGKSVLYINANENAHLNLDVPNSINLGFIYTHSSHKLRSHWCSANAWKAYSCLCHNL